MAWIVFASATPYALFSISFISLWTRTASVPVYSIIASDVCETWTFLASSSPPALSPVAHVSSRTGSASRTFRTVVALNSVEARVRIVGAGYFYFRRTMLANLAVDHNLTDLLDLLATVLHFVT